MGDSWAIRASLGLNGERRTEIRRLLIDGVDQGSRRLLNGMTWPVWWSSWRSSVYLVVEGRYDGGCGVESVPD